MFAERLKLLREKAGISQYKLADILKLSRSAVSAYELGKRMPDFCILKKIADYFDVSTDYLLDSTTIKSKMSVEKENILEAINYIYKKEKHIISEKPNEYLSEILDAFTDYQKNQICEYDLSPILEVIYSKWDIEEDLPIPENVVKVCAEALERALEIYFIHKIEKDL